METVRLPKVTNTPDPYCIVAPRQLIIATRGEFRRAALELIDRAVLGRAASVAVDLLHTAEIDASGLGMLILLQKRAREQGLTTRLLNADAQVLRLLTLTKLDYLFELEG